MKYSAVWNNVFHVWSLTLTTPVSIQYHNRCMDKNVLDIQLKRTIVCHEKKKKVTRVYPCKLGILLYLESMQMLSFYIMFPTTSDNVLHEPWPLQKFIFCGSLSLFALWLIVSIVVFVKFVTRQVCGTGPEPEWREQMNRKEE